jgi:hypothetical chaperone protein
MAPEAASSFSAACGVDFGTSNSAVALPGGRVLPIDPEASEPRLFRSVLFFPEEERTLFAGAEAIARYLEDNAGRFIQSVKTWLPSTSFHATQIRNAPYTLEDLIALLLRRIRVLAEQAARSELRSVVLGRPAVFSLDPVVDALAQGRLEKAAEKAGFTHVRFVIEPIAAALTYEATLEREERVLVADFGAGTSDLTVMRLSPERRNRPDRRDDVIGSAGVYVGGDKFDAAIMKHALLTSFGAGSRYKLGDRWMDIPQHIQGKLLSWHEMSFIREKATQELIQTMLKTSDRPDAIAALHDLVMFNLGYHLFRAIERAKVQLSSAEEATIDFEEERISIHKRITRAQFEKFSAPLLSELEACVTGLLARTGGEKSIDAVFLTGGSSQIPAVRNLFARIFGAGRLRAADAFTSVAEGLGRAAGAGS